MRRIVIAIGATLSGLVLLFSWPTSTNQMVTNDAAGDAGSATTGTETAPGTPDPNSPRGTGSTYDGAAASTRHGNVQVRITVADGVITAAEAINHPNSNGNDQQINAYAIPILVKETLAAQNAGIDMVSGATVTSEGYVQSLQNALDQAGL
jgi:uncharacterized protein with FMN-binding domain